MDGKDGDGLQLEKVGLLFQVLTLNWWSLGPESTLDRSFRKNLSQIFFSCSKKYITHK